MYEFFDMGGFLVDNGGYQRILIPYHLICEEKNTMEDFDLGAEYKTKFSVENFFDYYRDSGWYDVERGTDYLIINGYINEEKVLSLNNELKMPLRHMKFWLPIKIQFKSSDEIGVNVFTISDVV